MPCTEKKVSSVFFCHGLHVLPCPNNFSPACLGCKNEVVDGFMCLEIFEKSVRTAFGEPLARSFAQKMVLAPKPTPPILTKFSKVHFGVFSEGGGSKKSSKIVENEAFSRGGGLPKSIKTR